MKKKKLITVSVIGLIILIIGSFVVSLMLFLYTAPSEEFSIVYPFNESVFPRDIAPPVFWWEDKTGARNWRVEIEFQDKNNPIKTETTSKKWTPEKDTWEYIKERSLEKPAQITVTGIKKIFGVGVKGKTQSVSIETSNDEVGAPIFFRSVPLPFEHAINHMDSIKWCLGEVSSEKPPKVLLENMPVCGNCHSFSAKGNLLGMDVDYANDKGSYVIAEISKEIVLSNDKIITWSDYKKEDNEATYGLLSQVSPSGRYVISTLKDRSFFSKVDDLEYSQLFFPLKGILVYYDLKTRSYHALPGADDKKYVQSNPSWSPDGKHIIFAKNEVGAIVNDQGNVLLSEEEGEEYLKKGKKFRYDLYRIPFNSGKGGKAEPVRGASNNGMSNYFAKYSPDGKWIVFCKANSFMLLQPDSRLFIMSADGGEPREMTCNTSNMNSWHSWSPNSRWLVFSSKIFTPYTQLFITHIDEEGNDSPPVLLSNFSTSNRAANIPEFINIKPDEFNKIHESFVTSYSYAKKASELLINENPEGAELAFRKAIEIEPSAINHFKFGYFLFDVGQYNKAEKEFKKAEKEFKAALDLDSNILDVHLLLGKTYLMLGQYNKAVDQFENALKVNPKSFSVFEGLGMAKMMTGDLDGAQKDFETVLKINPHYSNVLGELGLIYMEKKEFKKAINAFRTALEDDPEDPNICFNLAEALTQSGTDLTEAVSLYKKYLNLRPADFNGHISLGNLYLNLNDINSAIQEFKTALNLNPNLHDLKTFISDLEQKKQ